MKIVSVKIFKLSVPLEVPLKISLGTITHAKSCLVEITTDDGLKGYGEGAPGPFVTGENLEGTAETLRILAEKLTGLDPRDLEPVHEVMDRTVAYANAAKAAIDIACYDILGKSAGLPLWKLLGGYESHVVTDMTIGIDAPEIMAARAKECAERGFSVIKIKVGEDAAVDLARVKAIRKAVGDDVRIRLDANQAWNAKQAVELLKRFDEYDIELVEQPVPGYDTEGLKYVTAHSRMPVMADESCMDAHDAEKLVTERAADMINIKLMKCGGLYEAKKISGIAEAAGMECMVGCMAEESGTGLNAAAALAAACRVITKADLDSVFSLKELPYEGGFQVEDDQTLVLPNEPGLGISGLKAEMLTDIYNPQF